jgi:hypothetical protein
LEKCWRHTLQAKPPRRGKLWPLHTSSRCRESPLHVKRRNQEGPRTASCPRPDGLGRHGQDSFFLISLSRPLMRKQPNYTCMLKNLLKLYCIWTWDTLWVVFVCVQFCSTLCIPFDETTTEQHLRNHLQDWRLRRTPKLLRLNFIAFELGDLFYFFNFFLFYILFYFIYVYIFLSFTYFLFLLLSLFFLFFIFNPLCLSNACSTNCRFVHQGSLFMPLKLFCLIPCFVFSYLSICFSLFL